MGKIHNRISSPEATGGAGPSFEQKVGAYWLAQLLVGCIPPIFVDCVIQRVAFQTEHLGSHTDDLLITCANVAQLSTASFGRRALANRPSGSKLANGDALVCDDERRWNVCVAPKLRTHGSNSHLLEDLLSQGDRYLCPSPFV